MKTKLQVLCLSTRSVQALAISIYLLATVLLASCTAESDKTDRTPTKETDSANRREVLVSLKNKLTVKTTSTETKANTPIATEEENGIEALDIYVFGAKEENGTYTFRERFTYRQDGSTIPTGAKELNLTPSTDNATTTALLELQKGLFVRLYCIANQTELIHPTGNVAFEPLTYNMETGVLTDGTPNEENFCKFHTPLLTDASPALGLPLPMVGAQTTPIDLTDLNSSARVQVGFKLTRIMARFDVSNIETASKFHLESISMGNGRRGTTFFPVQAYGNAIAADDELITYPACTFDGGKANTGLQVSAFYSYPSPLDDKGYLILNGTYQVNKTETKEVSYQIPFIQQTTDGGSVELEINANHRYTIGITKADEYLLNFTLDVDEWDEEGNIDEYIPESNGKATFNVTIPEIDTKTQYEESLQTVSLSLIPDSYFDLDINSNANLTLKKTYAGGLAYQKYDWLDVETVPDIETRTNNLKTYKCKISLKNGYTEGRYPRAILRFQNTIDGTENVLFVQALSAPQVIEVKFNGEGNYNTADILTSSVSMYRTTACDAQLKIYCADEFEFTNIPDWLKIEKGDIKTDGTIYKFTITDPDAVITDNKVILVMQNKAHPDLTGGISLNLLSTEITASNQTVVAANSGSTNLTVSHSPEGCIAQIKSWESQTPWCTIGTSVISKGDNGHFSITQSDNSNTVMKEVTILLKNKIPGGKDKEITLIPIFNKPTLSKTSLTLENVINLNTDQYILTITAPGGHQYVKASNSSTASITRNADNTYTIKAKYKGTTAITFANASNTSLTQTLNLTVSIDLNGKAVWKYDGLYIANTLGSRVVWNENISYCSSLGAGWRLPTKAEVQKWIDAPGRRTEWQKNGFLGETTYWSTSTSGSENNAWIFSPQGWYLAEHDKSHYFWARCVKTP